MPSEMVFLDQPHRYRVINAESSHTANRFQLDYATWWARLAGPGSRFKSTATAPQNGRQVTPLRPMSSITAERRTA